MSAINGDKARFHRQRKQKIERRRRQGEVLRQAAEPAKTAAAPSQRESKTVAV